MSLDGTEEVGEILYQCLLRNGYTKEEATRMVMDMIFQAAMNAFNKI